MLKIYNTLTKKVEVFKPIKEGFVGFYSCGPTVYNFAHIGNFRSFVFYDLLKRYLKYKGYKVKHVMNITDVDDKTIRDSKKEGLSLKEFTEKYTKYFIEDLKSLNIELPDVMPKATEHINEMIDLIKKLIDKGLAYKASDGSTYYDVSKFKDYGKLSGIKVENLKAGARVSQDEYSKDEVHDFALWKAYSEEDGDVYWETELGKGRPGWHIECSAMSMKYLGETFDIHSGGIDLVFPHHENEIAQSEGATGKKFVNYWVHCEFLKVNGKKMSKSLGNFYTLRDILKKGYDPIAVRFLLLSTHYRQQLNFTFEALKSAENTIEKLREFIRSLLEISLRNEEDKDKSNDKVEIKELIEKARTGFEQAMDNDLNISEALASIFEFVNEINKRIMKNEINKEEAKMILDFMFKIDSVLGLKLNEVKPREVIKEELVVEKEKLNDEITRLLNKLDELSNLSGLEKKGISKEEKEAIVEENIKKLLMIRNYLRRIKDFDNADRIRSELLKKNIVLSDTPEGTKWSIKN